MLWDARNHYRHTHEALRSLRSGSERGDNEPVIRTSGLTVFGEPHADSGRGAAELRVALLLFLAGCCLAILYGAARMEWWLQTWPPGRPAAKTLLLSRRGALRPWIGKPSLGTEK
jgi:hypothetical protein